MDADKSVADRGNYDQTAVHTKASLMPTSQSRFRFVVLTVFLTIVFLIGGGSRADIVSLYFLRPFAIAVIVYALLASWSDRNAVGNWPTMFVLGAGLLVLLQLIPLPPAIWQLLPGRDLIVETDLALGLGDMWRPLTLSPSRSLNTLFSLLIPLAAILLYQIQSPKNQEMVWKLLLACVVASLLFGIAQILDGAGSAFYTYRITNDGRMVGLFANRNHNGVFLGFSVVILAVLSFRNATTKEIPVRAPIFAVLAAVVGLTCLVVGSRAGLIVYAVNLAASLLYIWVSLAGRPQKSDVQGKSAGRKPPRVKAVFWIGSVLLFAALFALAIYLGRGEAAARLQDESVWDDPRYKLLPVYLQMLQTYFLTGSGFGSFELVFRIFEPDSFLHPQFLNHAHNDFVQVVIEGGLPAVALLLGFVVWFGNRLFGCLRAMRDGTGLKDPWSFVAIMFIISMGIASLVDYPLRVPSLAMFFMFACGQLAKRPQVSRSSA